MSYPYLSSLAGRSDFYGLKSSKQRQFYDLIRWNHSARGMTMSMISTFNIVWRPSTKQPHERQQQVASWLGSRAWPKVQAQRRCATGCPGWWVSEAVSHNPRWLVNRWDIQYGEIPKWFWRDIQMVLMGICQWLWYLDGYLNGPDGSHGDDGHNCSEI